MTDNTSGVRRGTLSADDGQSVELHNDPNGTHHLTKIDDFVPVKRETWDRVMEALRNIDGLDRAKSMTTKRTMGNIARVALAEIGEVKGE